MATIGSALEGEETDIMERASLEQLITFACRIDDILFLTADRKEDRTWTPREPVQGRVGTMSVPQEEKDRRSKEGICVKCGKGKHRFALCQQDGTMRRRKSPLREKLRKWIARNWKKTRVGHRHVCLDPKCTNIS